MIDKKPIFLPGLNGIRAIAAIGVLLSHINLSLPKLQISSFSLFGFDERNNHNSWVLGEHGVTMFFVLSGFLITFLLCKEFEQTRSIRIKDFYVRRILRIWPLYYLYIALCVILFYNVFDFHIGKNMVYYMFFLANVPFVYNEAYLSMDHLWSIGVEEQFYLFWPVLFLFFIRRRFVTKTVVAICVLAILRVLLWYFQPFSTLALFSLVNRFDCMIFGALGAYLLHENNPIIEWMRSRTVQYFCLLVLVLMFANQFWFINSIIEIFLICFVTLGIILGQIDKNSKIVNLENKTLSYIGKLSFGIYVYHPLIILLMQYVVTENNLVRDNWIFCVLFYSFIIGSTFAIAHLSFFYYERRFLKLKHRFSVVESTNEAVKSLR